MLSFPLLELLEGFSLCGIVAFLMAQLSKLTHTLSQLNFSADLIIELSMSLIYMALPIHHRNRVSPHES
jgi:hypothetical protein